MTASRNLPAIMGPRVPEVGETQGAGVFAAIQAAPAGPTATIGGVTIAGQPENVQGGSSFAEHSRLDRGERQQRLRESQEAGDVGRGAQVTIENDVRIDRERRRTGRRLRSRNG